MCLCVYVCVYYVQILLSLVFKIDHILFNFNIRYTNTLSIGFNTFIDITLTKRIVNTYNTVM